MIYFIPYIILFLLLLLGFYRDGGYDSGEISIIAFVSLALIAIAGNQYVKKEKERNAKCKHGTVGALYKYKKCSLCDEEKAREEVLEALIKEEENERIRARQEREHREWLAKIRLPEYLIKMDWKEFERLTCDLFRRMGYEVEETPYSGDSGIDGYLKKDGKTSILQCKRSKGYIGEPILRDLYGTMHATGAHEGYIITTGKVSDQAKLWARNKPIKLIELDELVKLIRAHYSENDIIRH